MSSDSLEIPERLGRYEILERLASGGMGEVFVGRFVGPGGFIKPVAVKRIHPHLAGDENFIHMLHDEANVAASIRHPNIIATIDVGSEGGNHFVVLDYVSGDSLARLLRDLGKRGVAFPDWLVAWIGAETASALHAAHEAKALTGESLEIIHRDVSLANVLLSDAGHPMLFDFGVAKGTHRMHQTAHGELKGKLPYMAPETFKGAPVDRTVDIFSLGVMLYELATGLSPFARASDLETITALQSAVVEPPSRVMPMSVRASLDPIILRAMARERPERYQTAAMVEQDLRAWARACAAPHDAASASAWVLENFPARSSARKALLARIASSPSGPSSRSASSPSSIRSVSDIIAAPSSSRTGPGYDKTQPLYASTLKSPGQTPPPPVSEQDSSGQTDDEPRAEVSATYDKTQAMLQGVTPAPFGPPPPSSSTPLSEPSTTTDVSIPGVARGDTQIIRPTLAVQAPPKKTVSPVHVLLGVASTFAVVAFALLVVLLSRDKPEQDPAAAAPSPPPPQTASVAPIVEPTLPVATAEAVPAVSASVAPATVVATTSSKAVAAPRPTSIPRPTTTSRKGGSLVRSYD